MSDNFANRILLSGSAASATGSNIGATGEPGEPSQSGVINSAWWSWTPSRSGTYTIDTKNSNFDTWLSVFNGNQVSSLNLITSNDDAEGNLTSLVSLYVSAGATYQIAVDGFNSNMGNIQLNIIPVVINGTVGRDFLSGTAYSETINGFGEHDQIYGEAGNDTLNGNEGDDRLDGGLGADQLAGGLGIDTYVVDNVGDVVNELPDQGIDRVESSITYTLRAEVENLSLSGTGAINGTGNDLVNTITGNAGNNTLDGRGGADQLIGGLGHDFYRVDNTGDIITELAGQGSDEIWSAVTYTLPEEVENLQFRGAAALNGTGNNLDNGISGNDGNNVLNGGIGNDNLYGGFGADTLIGGLGNDTYNVADAGDIVIEFAGQGIDNVGVSDLSYTLPEEVENLNLYHSRPINGTGNTLANTIIGNHVNNTLNGRGGQDILTGDEGADTFLFQFGESSVSARDSVTDFVIGTDKIDLLTQGGAVMNAPSGFSRAADNSTATTLQLLVDQVFIDTDGGLAGNQALGIDSAALVVTTNSSIVGNYLVINDATAGFQASNDLVIKLRTTGTLPPVGAIPVTNFFA